MPCPTASHFVPPTHACPKTPNFSPGTLARNSPWFDVANHSLGKAPRCETLASIDLSFLPHASPLTAHRDDGDVLRQGQQVLAPSLVAYPSLLTLICRLFLLSTGQPRLARLSSPPATHATRDICFPVQCLASVTLARLFAHVAYQTFLVHHSAYPLTPTAPLEPENAKNSALTSSQIE